MSSISSRCRRRARAENWAHDRLQAAGDAAAARVFIIQDASVIEIELPRTTGHHRRLHRPAGAALRRTLAGDAADRRRSRAARAHGVVKATRSQSVLESITPNEREQTWYDMTKALMADFDRQMSHEISANFGGYFQ